MRVTWRRSVGACYQGGGQCLVRVTMREGRSVLVRVTMGRGGQCLVRVTMGEGEVSVWCVLP